MGTLHRSRLRARLIARSAPGEVLVVEVGVDVGGGLNRGVAGEQLSELEVAAEADELGDRGVARLVHRPVRDAGALEAADPPAVHRRRRELSQPVFPQPLERPAEEPVPPEFAPDMIHGWPVDRVWLYFNNDWEAFAVRNAERLRELLDSAAESAYSGEDGTS